MSQAVRQYKSFTSHYLAIISDGCKDSGRVRGPSSIPHWVVEVKGHDWAWVVALPQLERPVS